MNAGDYELMKIIPAVRELKSVSPDQYGEVVHTPRRILCRYINRFLGNVNNVIHELALEGCSRPFCTTLLEFIQHSLDSFPVMFVLSSEKTSDSCWGFCSWLCARLLRVLAEPNCSPLHGRISRLLADLLGLVNIHSTFLFRRISRELFQLLWELIEIKAGLLDRSSEEECNNCDATLKSFSTQLREDAAYLTPTKIELTSLRHVEQLQLCVTQILDLLMGEGVYFNNAFFNELWHIVVRNLYGSLSPLKVATMKLSISLLDAGDLPDDASTAYLLQGLMNIVMLMWQSSELRPELLEPCRRLLLAVLSKLRLGLQHNAHVSLLEYLVDSIKVFHGFHGLQHTDLFDLVLNLTYEVAACVVSSGKADMGVEVQAHLSALCSPLVQMIGTTPMQIKGFVSCFRLALREELFQWAKRHESLAGKTEPITKIDEPGCSTMDRKGTVMADRSLPLLTSILQRLDHLMSASEHCSVPGRLEVGNTCEGLTVIFRVLAMICGDVAFQADCRALSKTSCNACWEILSPSKTFLSRLMHATRHRLSNLSPGERTHDDLLTLVGLADALLCIHTHCSMLSLENMELLKDLLMLPWSLESIEPIASSSTNATLCTTAGNRQHLGFLLRQRGVFSPTMLAHCVSLLAIIPCTREEAPVRLRLMELAAQNQDEVVRIAVVGALPQLLIQLGPTFNDQVINIVVSRVRDPSPQVREKLAMCLGKYACLLANSGVLVYCGRHEGDDYESLTDLPGLLCCGFIVRTSHTHIEKACLDPAIFLPFLSLLEKDQPLPVKLALISSMREFFRHVKLDSKEPDTVLTIGSWLHLLHDPNRVVSLEFCLRLDSLASVFELRDDIENKCHKLLISRFSEASAKAKGAPVEVHEALLKTVVEVVRVLHSRDVTLCALLSIHDCLVLRNRAIVSAAFFQTRILATVLGLVPSALFLQYKKPLCQCLVVFFTTSNVINTSFFDVLSEVANAFDFPSLTNFLNKTIPHLLTFLATEASSKAEQLTDLLAGALKQSKRTMLLSSFKYIFAHLVCCCTKLELEKALNYVKKQTEIELPSLLRQDFQALHNELLLHLGESYDQVFIGLTILSDASSQGFKIHSPEQMADYLQPRLMGVLAFFNVQLLQTSISIEEKRRALSSLVALMKLMGPRHVTEMRVKMLTTLKTALMYKDHFPELCCRAWEQFVRCLEPSCLGHLLSQIIVAVLPLMPLQPAAVTRVFVYMIVENRAAVHEHLHEAHILPEHPDLQPVLAVLQEYKQSTSGNLVAGLQQAMQAVRHEHVDVRICALARLREILCTNQDSVLRLCAESDAAEPVITHLVAVLLEGCRDADPGARILFGECLGELGAIDPGRLDLTAIGRQHHRAATFVASVDEQNFANELLTKLTRAFLATADNVRVQDCAAYAMQELLHIYECKDGSTKEQGNKLWTSLPDHVCEVLKPHLQARYRNSAPSYNWDLLKKPIFQNGVETFNEWVCTWAGYLITKVRKQPAQGVFAACAMIVRYDVTLALFLLPHILVHTLIDGVNNEADEIFAEVMAVLMQEDLQDSRPSIIMSDRNQMSAQTVFSVLDHLTQWARHIMHSQQKPGKVSGSLAVKKTPEHLRVNEFMNRIPQHRLAVASYCCQAYTRALMHFEIFMRQDGTDIQQHLGFLQTLYMAMDEADGVAGVTAMRCGDPTLDEQTLEHESIGQLRDATACYERAIQLEPNKISHRRGLLGCLLQLGELSTAFSVVNGIMATKPEWSSMLDSYRVEAAWKLTRWDDLEKCLGNDLQSEGWNMSIGRLLLSAKQHDSDSFQRLLQTVRAEQMVPLSAASLEHNAYQRVYENVVKMHMLCDLEHTVLGMLDVRKSNFHWQARLDVTQNSFRVREPILELRRALLGLSGEQADVRSTVGECWLQSARMARKAGHHQTAYNALLNAQDARLAGLALEKAKGLWSQGKVHQALIEIKKNLEQQACNLRQLSSGGGVSGSDPTALLLQARAMLLTGRLMEETANFESTAVIKQYKEVIHFNPEWEACHFYLAKYFDKVMLAMTENESNNKSTLCSRIIFHFGRSLQFGCQFIYQSPPRMLTLWLDFGSTTNANDGGTNAESKVVREGLVQLKGVMMGHARQLPAYQFLTAFSQLTSRICHPQPEVWVVLRMIILKVFQQYTQQAMWLLLAVSMSSHNLREERCQDVFLKAQQHDNRLTKLIRDLKDLNRQLVLMTNKQMCAPTLSMSRDFGTLKHLVESSSFSPVLIPLQRCMTPNLPSSPGSHLDHDPFPRNLVYIQGFKDLVEVINSMQKPKKFTLLGSDGSSYIIMCKPRDDLRKDFRMMEFNMLINKFLRKNAETRRRGLGIHTYAAIPLNQECGLIEWVPNTTGLRSIIGNLHTEKGIGLSSVRLRKLSQVKDTNAKLSYFRTEILPHYPPIFYEWFLRNFPDPTSWYNSRSAFSRSAAVMSMVGYVLGLGDRHLDNILLDSHTGECIHVDFSCLFNKGEQLQVPELVPFRLTKDMVHAMGPMGYEGLFRRACELTLRLMRNEREVLVSVLQTFIHDPLMDTRERTNTMMEETAKKNVQKIEERLQGIIRTEMKGLPLSIEGQVHYLIQQATSDRLLCQMYIGWCPYM
uniref:LOW QUALITY PROTEIN: serine/threonine-protein kinase ATR n=1 Tax=Myxine glutinosa TaxID=7769 RepID=UPI00358FE87A